MNDILNTLITSNTINFLVVSAIIVFLCKKLNVKAKTQELRDEIKNYVEDSENEKKSAEKSLEESEELVKKLPEEIEKIKSDTQVSMQNLSEKSLSDTEKHKQDLSGNARRLLRLEIKDFKQRLSNVLAVKSVELAKQNAADNLKDNKSLHAKYIDEAINELDGINL